jgi:hypothetical protein
MRRLLLLLLTLLVATGTTVVAAGPASAEARVDLANADGEAVADVDGPTVLQVSGTGFQSVRNGFGGIYVFFGWVSGPGWGPSRGGASGTDYRYAPDEQARENQGFQRFVAFPGGDTADSANGGVISADGRISLDLTVPGPVFEAIGADGGTSTIDCREVTCGVITIGAHGVVNGANETFTPLEFAQLDPTDGSGSTDADDARDQVDSGSDAGTDEGADAGPDAGRETPSGPPTVEVDRATAVAGRVLTFTGGGFQPGELVLATLDDGIAAVGPLTAGTSGEVAGLLQLPAATPAGTHELRLTGAASGAAPAARFAVRVAVPQPATASEDEAAALAVAAAGDDDPTRASLLFAAAGLLVLLLALVACAVRIRRARRRRTGSRSAAVPGPPATGTPVVHPAVPGGR